MPYLLLLILLMAGCTMPEETIQTTAPTAVVAEERLILAEKDFKAYMEENFAQTSWYANIVSYGIAADNDGTIVMGVITRHENDYVLMQPAIQYWIEDNLDVGIDKLWFMYNGSPVQQVDW